MWCRDKRELGVAAAVLAVSAVSGGAHAQAVSLGRPDLVADFPEDSVSGIITAGAEPAIAKLLSGTISLSTDDAACVPTVQKPCFYTVNSLRLNFKDFEVSGHSIKNLTLWNWYSVANLDDIGLGLFVPEGTQFAASFTAPNGRTALVETAHTPLLVQADPSIDRIVISGTLNGTVEGVDLQIGLLGTAQIPFTNHPPVAKAGPAQHLTTSCFATTKLDSSATSDPDGDLSFSYYREGPRSLGPSGRSVNFLPGPHLVTLVAADSHGAQDTDGVQIDVTDSGATPATSGARGISLQSPLGVTPSDLALGAVDDMSLKYGSTVVDAQGVGSPIANLGRDGVRLDANAKSGTIYSGGPVHLGKGSVVDGAVHATAEVFGQARATVTGPVETTATLTPAVLTSWNAFEGRSKPSDRHECHDVRTEHETLAPGSYGDIALRPHTHLTLSHGSYFFDSLKVQPGGTLLLDESEGTIVIYVENALELEGSVKRVGGDADSPANLLLVYLGRSQVSVRGAFEGTIVAPAGSLNLGPQAQLFGAFFGHSVTVQPQTKIVHKPFDWSVQQASRDACIVSPFLECVSRQPGSGYLAHFGYEDVLNDIGASIPRGLFNRFSVAPESRGQPTQFLPGMHHDAFQVPFDGSDVFWILGNQAIKASRTSKACP